MYKSMQLNVVACRESAFFQVKVLVFLCIHRYAVTQFKLMYVFLWLKQKVSIVANNVVLTIPNGPVNVLNVVNGIH